MGAKLAILAFLCESLTEYLFDNSKLKPYQKYLAMAFGVLLTIGFDADFFQQILGMETSVPYLGHVLTGLVVGRGANYLHDFATLPRVVRARLK